MSQPKLNIFQRIRLFYGEMSVEVFKKTTWTGYKELRNLTLIVIVAVALLGAFVSLSDFALFNLISLVTDIVRAGAGAA